MTYIYAYLLLEVLFLLVLIGFLAKRSVVVTSTLIGFLLTLNVFCTDAFDLLNMERSFNNFTVADIRSYAPAYGILMKLSVDLGLGFFMFKALIGGITIFFTFLAVKKTSTYYTLVFSLYAIYPFFGTISQIRNGVMAALAIYSIVTYILPEGKPHKIKFVTIIVAASLIHFSAIFFLIFLLINKKVAIRKYVLLVSMFYILLLYFYSQNLLDVNYATFPINARALRWFDYKTIISWGLSGNHNWKGKSVLIILHLVGYALFLLVARNLKKCLASQNKNPNLRGIKEKVIGIENIEKMELLLLCVIPTYLLSPTYFRMYQNMVLVLYITTAQYYFVSKKTEYKVFTASLLVAGVLLHAISLVTITDYMQGGLMKMLNSYNLFR